MSKRNKQNGKENESTTNGTSEIKTKQRCIGQSSGNNILEGLLQWDEEYTSKCAVFADKNSTFRPVMKLLEISCHGIPWLLATIVLILSVHQARHIELLVNLFYGLIIDLIAISISKMAFKRSRPVHNEMDMFVTVSIDNYSFPSGHASRAGMLACFFALRALDSPTWIVFTLLWSFIVTFSRVMLGRHHLVDVICGYLLGIGEYLVLSYLWISRETSLSWLELYFSHFHL